MNGLDKIIEKIEADGREAGEATLADARERAEATVTEARARADELRASLAVRTEREAEDIVSRAKSSAAMLGRNVLLDAKSAMIDRAFDAALESFCRLPEKEYFDLLVNLLTDAVTTRVEEQKTMIALYGEGEADLSVPFSVVLSAADREKYGARLVDAVKASGKLPKDAPDVLLSERTAPIRGGLILAYGDVESNCSLERLVAAERTRSESVVYQTLFGEA